VVDPLNALARARRAQPHVGDLAPFPSSIPLHVAEWPELGITWLIGTRAQLEASGVIPAGLEWPPGSKWVFWRAGGRRYLLRRQRRRCGAWSHADWWGCRVQKAGDAA